MNTELLESLPEPLQKIFNEINNDIIKLICKRLNQLQYEKRITNAMEYAIVDLKSIENILQEKMKLAKDEVDIFFDKVANENLEFSSAFFNAKKLKPIKHFSERKALENLVNAIKKETNELFKNISKTTGFSINGKIKSLREQYLFITDKAIISLKTGVNTYHTTLRQSVKDMARSGVKRVYFESGYSRRLDSQMSMNILEGARRLTMSMQETLGKEYGADGVEISAHGLCAPDHQSIQGRQFSKEDFTNINSSLARPIGSLNCKHIAFPIVLGVSYPAYSKKELETFNKYSNSTKVFDEKPYTMYEASQKQRKLETKIRKLKEEKLALKAFGDSIGEKNVEKDIKKARDLYFRFSKEIGLAPYKEKLTIY